MMRISIVTLLAGIGFCLPCAAGLFSHRCSKCGCEQVEKVCRVVPDVKNVTKTKFVVECNEVCLPGKSVCEERMVSDSNCIGGQRCESVKVPTCGRIVLEKKLKKVTTTVEEPGWKCVVETVCNGCGHHCGSTGVPGLQN